MDWSKGYTASSYLTIVDPASWRDTERVEITGGSVARQSGGLRQSADLDCTSWNPEQETWVRVWLDVRQGQDGAHEALFTGLTSVPEREIRGQLVSYPLSCYSVLKPAEDVLLQRGWFAGEGADGAVLIQELLSVSPAPFSAAANPPRLSRAIIAENGETHLSMAEKILAAMGWVMTIGGDGTISIGPASTEIKSRFGPGNDVVEPRVSLKKDWFTAPNVYRAIRGDDTAEARDDDESSPLSTVTRGREIWREESGPVLSDGESLEAYAQRRLREAQASATAVSYDRRFDPAVNVGDLVRLHYPAQKLMDDYRVISQNIRLGGGATVSEEVRR